MHTKIKIAAASAAVLIGGFAAIGAANASARPPQTRPATTSSVPTDDRDTLQQGDQTTPDQPGSADQAKAGTGGNKSSPEASPESTGETTSENADESAAESENANDGPGGHADGPGNVDHQFEGQE